jgi:hypothetical protein
MLHLTTLLVLFAAAAFKSDHTALLAATLVSEAHTVFFLSRRLQVPTLDQKGLTCTSNMSYCFLHLGPCCSTQTACQHS